MHPQAQAAFLDELEEKRAALRDREVTNAASVAKYPHYQPGRDNVCNIHCAGCGKQFNLTPALCMPCLEKSLESDGPYRTAPSPAPEGHPYRTAPPRDGDRVRKLEQDLDFERWRTSRLTWIAVAFGITTLVLGVWLKVLYG